MMWFKILAVVVACVALAIYHNQVTNVDLAERNKLAAQQQEKKMEQREKLLQAMEEARSAGDSKEFFKLLHQVAGIE